MITLLEKLKGYRDLPDQVLPRRSGKLLEWPRIKAQVARHCLNPRAADLILARKPFVSQEPISYQQALADEINAEGKLDIWPPLMDLEGALELLEQPPPVRLEGPELVHVAGVAETLDQLRDHLLQRRSEFAHWGDAAVQMATFSGLSGAIRRTLDRDGSILDAASPLLARLRKSIGGQERAVRQEMSQAMSQAKARGWTTGGEMTLRGDRFCIPLRSGDSSKVAGIVHDRSATGATLFVEPAQVVRLANELAETRLEIAAEEARILFELNRSVEQATAALLEAGAVMIELDAVRAQLLWSRATKGARALIDPGQQLTIRGGRHPLLLEALEQDSLESGPNDGVVPLDLEIPAEGRALVISGPNAGGKSVALKTVGVFCLLNQCGWDVPALEGTRLPLVRRLLVDLGDDQSIAAALSSFSAHLKHLSGFLAEAGPGTLVICDEIGSGTDPHEGAALAFAVLQELVRLGAQVLASTHYGILKASVHDHPLMINAAMDYDEKDLRPLFTFRVGDPGTSHAFDIAARMGIPEKLLAQARETAGTERVQVEQLLANLDRRAKELADQQRDVALQQDRLNAGNQELEKRLKGLDKEKRQAVADARKQADEVVSQGRREIEKAVRDIRSQGGQRRVVKQARDQIKNLEEELDRRLGPEGGPPPRTSDLSPGQRIRIPHLGLKGRILEIRGDKITAQAEGLKLTLTTSAIRPMTEDGNDIEGPPDTTGPSAEAGGHWTWNQDAGDVHHEIDLRGETGQEAWLRLDRLIDRAIPTGLEVIHVIHGFGTGRLRDHLLGRLKADPRVESFREAGQGRGGAGATRVKLKG